VCTRHYPDQANHEAWLAAAMHGASLKPPAVGAAGSNVPAARLATGCAARPVVRAQQAGGAALASLRNGRGSKHAQQRQQQRRGGSQAGLPAAGCLAGWHCDGGLMWFLRGNKVYTRDEMNVHQMHLW
jgi:hypothetical protein